MRDSPAELSSWKEIAQRLQVSVRTAQLWEKDRGLPVRRVPGKRGRVYLRIADLEAWLARADDGVSAPSDSPQPLPDADPVAVATWRPRTAGFEFALALVVLVGSAIAWALLTAAPDVGDPVGSEVRGDVLIVSDVMGHELWRASFPEGLRREPYAAGERFAPTIDDIDGDGLNEVVFVVQPKDVTRSSELVGYDTDGSVMWRHQPGSMVSTATEAFDDIYRITSVELLPMKDGTRDVILSAQHHVFYPNAVSRLSSSGELKARYWHAGHLGNDSLRLLIRDVSGDGDPEILLTGVSNARNAGTFVVLDPDLMNGAGAESAPAYRFQRLPPAEEIARVFFPRSSLTPADDRYTIGSAIRPGRSTITVSVQQVLASDADGHVLYTFGPDLSLHGVAASDSFIGLFRSLRARGSVGWPLEEELRRLEEIVILRPALAAEVATPD